MTKLPEIGKRYTARAYDGSAFEIAFIWRKSMCLIEANGELSIQDLTDFFEHYREVPTVTIQTPVDPSEAAVIKPAAQESAEVKKPMWKPVSELSKKIRSVYTLDHLARIPIVCGDKYFILTDVLNALADLEERVARLEKDSPYEK